MENNVIGFRVSEKLYRDIEREAKYMGVKKNEYIRKVLAEDSRKRKKERRGKK